MWCTLWSQIFRTLGSNISAKLKPNSKILYPFYQLPRWVRIMGKKRRPKMKISWHTPFKTTGVLCWPFSVGYICFGTNSPALIDVRWICHVWLVVQCTYAIYCICRVHTWILNTESNCGYSETGRNNCTKPLSDLKEEVKQTMYLRCCTSLDVEKTKLIKERGQS